MMAVVVALDAVQAIPFSYLRYQKRPLRFASLKMLFIILNIGLNLLYFVVLGKTSVFYVNIGLNLLYFVVLGKTSVFYVFFINLLCTGFITFFFLPDLFRIHWKFDGSLLRNMLSCSAQASSPSSSCQTYSASIGNSTAVCCATCSATRGLS